MVYKIIGEVNQIINNYEHQSIEIMNGLNFQQSTIIKMIEFYSNSRYLQGQLDELGKEKPFYNIGNAICDVEDAAVDIDTKDIQATADLPQDYDKSFMLTVELWEWMKESNFGLVLNESKKVRTRYGGVILKKCVEKDEKTGKKELRIEVPEWKNLVTDPINIEQGAIIEKHYMSPSQLAKKEGIWENVPEAMKLATKARQEKNQITKTATTKRIPVFEVRGEFPIAFYKQAKEEEVVDGDEFKFSYQLYIFAGDQDGKQVLLYSEDNTERVYKYLPRKKKSGRALGLGVIEENEQAQVWTNDAVQKQQRAFEYSSKNVNQTASRSLKGRNMLTEVENGATLETDDGKPITRVDLTPSGGMAQFENLIAQWYTQAEKTSSAYAAQRGETPPSGTPFRLQAQVLQQSSSVFEDLKEEMGIFLSEVFYEWVIPFLSGRLNKEHILSHEFEADELKSLDQAYSLHKANAKVIEQILAGELVSQVSYDFAKEEATNEVQQSKGHRFFDIPKDYYKDLKTKITINITGEQRNKAAALESLQNILASIATNPAILQDPVASQIFMRIVELSGAGISPISLVSGLQEQAKIQAEQQAMMAEQAQPQTKQLSLTAKA